MVSSVYPAWHGRALERLDIAGLSQNNPDGQGGHSSILRSPWETAREPAGHGSG